MRTVITRNELVQRMYDNVDSYTKDATILTLKHINVIVTLPRYL